jgi:NADH pyrophosphatase NudC (nudix superfamily)
MYEYVDYKTGMHEHFDMIYLVRPKNNVEINADYGEVTEIKWFSEDEINSLEIYENTKTILHNAFEKIK